MEEVYHVPQIISVIRAESTLVAVPAGAVTQKSHHVVDRFHLLIVARNLLRFVHDAGRRALPVEAFVMELPLKRKLLRYVTDAVVAGLITQCSLDREIPGGIERGPQYVVGPERDVASDAKVSLVHGNLLFNRFQIQDLRFRKADVMRRCDR